MMLLQELKIIPSADFLYQALSRSNKASTKKGFRLEKARHAKDKKGLAFIWAGA